MQPRLLKHPARLAGASLLRLQDDTRLVALAREGHEPAFAAIVDRYGPQLQRYCARLLNESHPSRAEDAVQQAFVNAHASMRASEQELALKPWLYRIAHNVSLNILRAAKDDREVLDEDRPGAAQTADVVELRERLRETLAAIQALPTAQRDALLLREIEGRSHEEIALALGVTEGGARQHLHRARLTLRAAASAVTPYPLLTRVLSAAAAEGGRSADLVSGAGAGAGAGAMKAVAGVLAAGAIAGEAVTVQLHTGAKQRHATAHSAAAEPAIAAANSASATPLDVADTGATPQGRGHGGNVARGHARGRDVIDDHGRRHGSSETHRSGSNDDSTKRGSSVEEHHHSGGEGELSHSGSGSSGSGSDGGVLDTSHDGSVSGSDDTTTTATTGGSDGSPPSGSSGPGGGETTTTTTPTDDHSGFSGGSDDLTPTTGG